MHSEHQRNRSSREGNSMEIPQIQCSPFNCISTEGESRHHVHHIPLSLPSDHSTSTSTHSSTLPIAVPTAVPSRRQHARPLSPLENTGGGRTSDSCRYLNDTLSPLEQAVRGGRRPSITFDPQVKLDGGKQTLLEAPLPRSSAGYRSPTSPGAGFDFGRQDQPPAQPMPSRSSFRDRRRMTAAHKFLSPPSSDGMDGVSSLTSESTMSPLSEFHTPPNSLLGSYFGKGGGMMRSPSSEGNPLSPGAASPWPTERENNDIPRNKSFSFGTGALPRPRPNRRRTSSERSFASCSSNGISPASMFLSSFGKCSQRPVETGPDSEGQEVGSYVLGKEIGRGGFSTVKEAFTIEDGVEVQRAVKIVRKRVDHDDTENDKIQAAFDHEVSLWRYLHHPNIMSLVSVFDTPFATFAFMQLNRDGSLFDLMKKPCNRQGLLRADLARRYSFQLSCALRYLHEDMRIVHGDVKLENCLLDLNDDREEGGNVRLCDFGLAKFIKDPHDDDDHLRPSPPPPSDTICFTGSLQYAAPEIIRPSSEIQQQQQQPRSPAVDIWAFGVMVYVLHTGTLPFTHGLQPKLAEMILGGTWDVEALRNCEGLRAAGKDETEKVVQVVKGCLCTNTERRWNIRDVLESAWFEGMHGGFA